MKITVLAVAAALLLGACDFVFRIDEVHARVDAAAGLATDGAQDAARANCVVDGFGTLGSQWSTFADPPRAMVAIGDTLSITLDKASNVHGGIKTQPRDFTGHSIEVDIVAVPSPSSETYMDWAHGDDWYSVAVDYGQLSYGFSVDGSQSTIEIPFDPDQHRGFRMTHDRGANVIRMSARDSSGVWIQLGTAPVVIPMTGLSVELAAGSYTQTLTTGLAQFDNFVTCGPISGQ